MVRHQIPDGVRAIALARYLARAYPMTPGHALRDALKKKDVRVNGEKSGGDRMVRGGDEIAVYLPEPLLTGAVRVLYEGNGLLAIEKPAGLPVDADADGIGMDTALTRARARYPDARLCHRLDAGTGGVLLLALDDGAERAALEAFRRHAVQKEYLCLTRGFPVPERATLVDFLIKDACGSRVRVGEGRGAQRAELAYRLEGRNGDCGLVRIALKTGRTHQIRVQMAHAGYPLLGDDKYGDRAFNREHGRATPALWCVRLEYEGLSIESTPEWM